jgi:MFS family permease
MAAALALWSATTALSGLATSYAILVLCRMGLALGESCCSPATLSLLSDYYPLKRRGVPIAIWTMSVPFGTMFGLVAGGWLSQSLGWRQAFIGVGVLGLALSPALLVLREPERGRFDPPTGASAPTSLRTAGRILWGSRAFRAMLLGGTLWSFVFCAIQAWSAPFYVRLHGLPLAAAGGWLALVFGLGGGGGALLGGALADRFGRRDARAFGRIPAIGCLLAIPSAMVEFLSPNLAVSLAGAFLTVLLLSLYLAPFSASTQSLVRPDMRALTSAVTLIATNLIGLGLGPLLTGWASDAFSSAGFREQGLRLALSGVPVVAVLAAAAFLRAGRWMSAELRELTGAPAA